MGLRTSEVEYITTIIFYEYLENVLSSFAAEEDSSLPNFVKIKDKKCLKFICFIVAY